MAADVGLVQFRHRLAIEPAGGEMEQEVNRTLEAETRQGLGQAGADTLQRLHFGEQRIENIGAHD